jgi:urea carboxylase-associated protein 2
MHIEETLDPRAAPSPIQGLSIDWTQHAADLPLNQQCWSEILPGGSHASWLLRRGTALRFVTLEANANCSVVLYALPQLLERYNMPDTLKAQHTAHLRAGHTLMSDMGRAMASITRDSLGWHDPLGALLDHSRMERQYGVARYSPYRNDMHRSGRDGLLIELAKHGLGARDLVAPVNLFSRVTVDSEGRFHFTTDHAPAGASLDLRCDMDVLLALSTAPHALDPNMRYTPAAIAIMAWRCGTAASDDLCRNSRPETQRAHHNTDRLLSA